VDQNNIPIRSATKERKMKNIFLLGIFIVCCAACKEEQATQPVQQTPYDQWRSINLHNYSIDQTRSCFCLHGGELMRVTVRSDTIAGVIRISDNSVVTFPYYVSIDSLFGIIRTSTADSLFIRYNAQFGYPEYLDVNPQLHPVDGGFLIETSNLHIP
jgi:hypothetical protein